MNIYLLALFGHITGALGFFVALGIEWTCLSFMRRARTAEQVRDWLSVATSVRRLGGASMVLLLATGFYMMATTWHGVAWILVALGTLILLMILAGALTYPRMAVIGQSVEAEGGLLSPEIKVLLHDRLLWLSMQARVFMALGIVFLMSVKPDLGGALITISTAAAVSLASALPLLHHQRKHEEPVM